MNECIIEYLNLLIIQYRNKPNAEAHIKEIIRPFGDICNLYKSFDESFNIDTAIGILGAIVGISRTVENIIPKEYFSFSNTQNGKTFGEGSFFNFNQNQYTSTELDDFMYRFFIKAKIIRNFTDGNLSGVSGIQLAIDYLFSGDAFITDNLDMSMDIWISNTLDTDKIKYAKELDLLPTPQGVRLKGLYTYDTNGTFGFSLNPNSKTFGIGKFAHVEGL